MDNQSHLLERESSVTGHSEWINLAGVLAVVLMYLLTLGVSVHFVINFWMFININFMEINSIIVPAQMSYLQMHELLVYLVPISSAKNGDCITNICWYIHT